MSREKACDWVLNQPWAITEEALQVVLSIAERTNESPEAVEARLGRPLDNTSETTIRDGVAIVPVSGPIARHANLFSQISGATSIDLLARDFRTALDDRSVRAVVLAMDTPGGTVSGVGEFASHVLAARGRGKPVVAYVGNQAASAGYWIASAADAVVVDPTATVGSIGVVMGMRKPADPKAGQARTVEFVSSQSPQKRPDPETEAGRAQIQAVADDLADVFVDAVAAHRGVSRETVLSDFGRGGVLVGARAVEAGMADEVGTLEGLIARLSRGDCPPRKTPRPARKGKTTREPAMSEPNVAPVAGDHDAEIVRLKSLLAKSEEARTLSEQVAARALDEAISARAEAFVHTFCGAAHKTAHAQAIRSAYVRMAADDHAHPLPEAGASRVALLKQTLESRPNASTSESVGSDPADLTRALGMDPAREDPTAADAERAELERIDASTRKFGASLNGKK